MKYILLVAVHGAGGGGWEYYKWKEYIMKYNNDNNTNITFEAIDLLPVNNEYEITTFNDYVNQIIESYNSYNNNNTNNNEYNEVYLIGASMGGCLIAKAAEKIKPTGCIYVCTTIPIFKGLTPIYHNIQHIYPSRIKWKDSPLQDTIDAIPDADINTQIIACQKFKDESGNVLNEIFKGVECEKVTEYNCILVPMNDNTISPSLQIQFGKSINAGIIIIIINISSSSSSISSISSSSSIIIIIIKYYNYHNY